MKIIFQYFVLQLLLFIYSCQSQSVILETKLGKIEGVVTKSVNGKPFSNFVGIPYAKPPIGQLRFKRPEPAEPWEGTFQAKENKQCLQFDHMLLKSVIGTEDCLVLNVYTPITAAAKGKLYPVMFFIHGGAFSFGSGTNDIFGAERFIDHDVILVTTNFRQGPLGFMSTSNDDLPANLGLWDQNLALQWVQKNIKDYGGDSGKVTLFGESSGAMAVMFHYLSPKSLNLFQGAIVQSGVATNTMLKLDKNPVFYARTLADRVGCNPDASTADLVTCLRQVDGAKIIEQTNLDVQVEFFPVVFKPVVDDFTSDPYIPKEPWDIINSGEFNHVPIIIGNNNDEGLLSAIPFNNDENQLKDLAKRWNKELGPLYLFGRQADDVDAEVLELTQEVNKFAFPGENGPSRANLLTGFKDLISDTIFNAIGSITARKLAEKSKSDVYEYIYKHMGTVGFMELTQMPAWKIITKSLCQYIGLNIFSPQLGVGHADELFVLFKPHQIPLEGVYTDADKAASNNLLTLWTDFAKTGNPTPKSNKWKKISQENYSRLEIDSGPLKMALDKNIEKRIKFWSKIWERIPSRQRLLTSPTWKNPMMFRKGNQSKKSKEEL